MLLFRRQQALLAQRFDATTLTVVSDPLPVANVVGTSPNNGSVAASVADNGTVVFRARTEQGGVQQLVWFNRSGRDIGSVGGASLGPAYFPDLSQAGDRVAIHATTNGNIDLWIVEAARGVRSRLTTDTQPDQWPVWSPDGSQIVFGSSRKGRSQPVSHSAPQVPDP